MEEVDNLDIREARDSELDEATTTMGTDALIRLIADIVAKEWIDHCRRVATPGLLKRTSKPRKEEIP